MARRVIDTNRYMTLGTTDAEGRPWVSPVYFAPVDYTELYWISSPDANHSRNLGGRPDVAIVVFDSSVPIGGAEAVYMRGRAQEVADPDPEQCATAFRARFEGVRSLSPEQLRPPAKIRLYRATVTEHSVLIRGRDPVRGRGVDHRIAVTLT
jgi:nitroimidazol reductase NimA-like FMN-containing flavoprotein (pyridoxamine 5'-phosphate oxidase superfamily)